MKERITALIEALSMSRSDFALKIGVQRSNITHVLDGRNKPGMDFMEKVLKAFPDLRTDWLMRGEGNMFNAPTMKSLFSDVNTGKSEPVYPEIKPVSNEPEKISTVSISDIISRESLKEKKIEKLIILYSDKTFETYFPE